jgi:Coenzyme PQQ synthesis protein D (PqqD)
MNSVDKPAAGIHLFYVDGAGVLFAGATQELHLLNSTATLIWSLLEEGHDARSAAAALQTIYGLDAEQSTEFVTAALAEWRDKHFLEGASLDPSDLRPAVDAIQSKENLPPWDEFSVNEERHYRILGSGFRLRFSSIAQARKVHPILEHLEVREGSSNETAVDIIEVSNRIVVYRDREGFADCANITELAPIVKAVVWVTTVNNHEYFLDIHAGVISDGSTCILLPAAPGSGKSTLTASLVHAGFQYFSDEVALLEEGTFNVFPVPLAICIKSTGMDVLAETFPILRTLEVHLRGDGKQVTYMPPSAGWLPASNDSRPVAALVFPRYTPGASTSFVPLSKGDALKRLLVECKVVSTPLDIAKVRALIEWISRTPCHSLSYGSTDGAISAVRSLFTSSAAAALSQRG